MKKTDRFFTLCSVCCAIASTVVLYSCTFEQDDYFDESASLRITHINDQLQDRLVKQSDEGNHGWLMQYFVAGTDDYSFEGFNIFARFYKDNKVTLAGNHRYLRGGNANKYTEYTSLYEMLAEEGPVLSFNTWNDVLTVLEDPVSPTAAPANVVSDGEGMNGDHNLVLSNYDDNTITFRGERHGASIRFIPCDRPWNEYMDAVAKTKSDITSDIISSYYVTNGVDTMYFEGLKKGYFNYCDRLNDPLRNKVLSCVFTTDGFRLHRADTLMHKIDTLANVNVAQPVTHFQEFRMAADSTCLISDNDSVRVIALWDNYIVNTRNSVWNFDPESLTADQKSIYDQIDGELKKTSKNYSLASVGLGKSSGNKAVKGLVITFYTNTAKTKKNTAGLALDTNSPAFGQMKISYDTAASVDGNMESIAKKCDIELLARQFAASIQGVYDMVPDSYFVPSSCQLKNKDGGNTLFMK